MRRYIIAFDNGGMNATIGKFIEKNFDGTWVADTTYIVDSPLSTKELFDRINCKEHCFDDNNKEHNLVVAELDPYAPIESLKDINVLSQRSNLAKRVARLYIERHPRLRPLLRFLDD